jgi:hypothetical protein
MLCLITLWILFSYDHVHQNQKTIKELFAFGLAAPPKATPACIPTKTLPRLSSSPFSLNLFPYHRVQTGI